MWQLGGGLLLVWFILKFIVGKGGFVHILLLCAIAILIVQFVATRPTDKLT